MKSSRRAFISTVSLLALLCGIAPGKRPRGYHHSGIVGRLHLEDVWLRNGWQVRVDDLDGEMFETGCDADGCFRINLKPGDYKLTPVLHRDGGGNLLGPSARVGVSRGKFVEVELPVVFGPA